MKKTLKSIQEQFGITPKDKLQEQGSREVRDLSMHISHKVSVIDKKMGEIYQALRKGYDDPGLPSDLKNVLRHIEAAIDYLDAK
jgi:hypothetical protein